MLGIKKTAKPQPTPAPIRPIVRGSFVWDPNTGRATLALTEGNGTFGSDEYANVLQGIASQAWIGLGRAMQQAEQGQSPESAPTQTPAENKV